jgi:hypothetical protein
MERSSVLTSNPKGVSLEAVGTFGQMLLYPHRHKRAFRFKSGARAVHGEIDRRPGALGGLRRHWCAGLGQRPFAVTK